MACIDIDLALAAWNMNRSASAFPTSGDEGDTTGNSEAEVVEAKEDACILPEYHVFREPCEMREDMPFSAETQHKLRVLAESMDKWKDRPAQRSQQWYDDRTFSVGASEIPTIIGGINPYQTIRSMVATKCGLLTIT